MRIVIDLQAAQASNRHRGIGRYALWLMQALCRVRGEHELVVVLSDLLADSVEEIRAELRGLLEPSSIHLWRAPGPTRYVAEHSAAARDAAECVREAFIAGLAPDMVLVSSLFEGLVDDAVTSIGNLHSDIPTAVILYDLIPLIYSDAYLTNPTVMAWYQTKLDAMRRADLVLAISESSRREGLEHLGLAADECVTISAATDARFRQIELTGEVIQRLRDRTGLQRPFVLYTGGIDHRKNVEGLIRAYALLPVSLRARHQLAIVCSIGDGDRTRLSELARTHGLADGELCLTGFISDEDLLGLYNIAELFVFPSWHEGFGLPALEAMRCGCAVIGGNRSSLPEVIGREDALFDPKDDAAIAALMLKVLSDAAFKALLRTHGLQQARHFEWDEVAHRALAAMAGWLEKRPPTQRPARTPHRPRLAYVSPLPPERSGISDYSAELLPELARHYAIDVIVQQDTVADTWVNANCAVRSVAWFLEHHARYDRVLYHFGNSSFHQHMFGLLEAVPGTVVLHDFFLSGILAHMDVTGYDPGLWARSLQVSHGWAAVRERHTVADTADVVWKYPANLEVLQQARGVIVHAESSRRLIQHWYGAAAAQGVALIPHLRVPAGAIDRKAARARLGIDDDTFLVASFGMIGPTKQSHRLVEGWARSALAEDTGAMLVLVGANDGGWYGQGLHARLGSDPLAAGVRIAGWTAPRAFKDYLQAADLAVQLRTLSRGETSGAVLDCMNHGLATIVNAHGSLADLPDDAVCRLDDDFSDDALARALERLHGDPAARRRLGKRARQLVSTAHCPRQCARAYRDAIEAAHADTWRRETGLIERLASVPRTPAVRATLAAAVALNQPATPRARQLLVDVSELVHRDAHTGIQRAVRSVLWQWLMNPPDSLRVEPVYADPSLGGYRYARAFTLRFLGCPPSEMPDAAVEFERDDIFLGLDLSPDLQTAHEVWLQALRRAGVRVCFVVYDLLCVQMPEMFVPGAAPGFHRWLELVSRMDGAICISRIVADELADWLQVFGAARRQPLSIDWFHLGSDVNASVPTAGLPGGAQATLETIASRPAFLMVGTIEPRKGHAQALDAFELLWARGVAINLVIVGKQGWLVEAFIEKLRGHPELGQRLFWLDGISDEFLERVYAHCSCLLSPSRGEGFGLPLIEAALHGLHILARDIPVFREVTGDHASYFSGTRAEDLAEAVRQWLTAEAAARLPDKAIVAPPTWAQSAQQLLQRLRMTGAPYRSWKADEVLRFWGADPRLHSRIGHRHSQSIRSNGTAGYLVLGPYVPARAGRYRVDMFGSVDGLPGADAGHAEIAAVKGTLVLARQSLDMSLRDSGRIVCFDFELKQDTGDLETRLWVNGSAEVELHRIEVHPIT